MGYIGLQPTGFLLDGSITEAKLDSTVASWILLATASASGSATIDFDTGIDFPAYDNFVLNIAQMVPADDDSGVTIVLSVDGGLPIGLEEDDSVEIRAAEYTTQFIRFGDPGYFYRNITAHINHNPAIGKSR